MRSETESLKCFMAVEMCDVPTNNARPGTKTGTILPRTEDKTRINFMIVSICLDRNGVRL
jgi:hypothetical protein